MANDPEKQVEAAGAKSVTTGDIAPIGRNIVQSLHDRIPKLTGAPDVYGGD